MKIKTLGMSAIKSRQIWREEFGNEFDYDGLFKYTNEFLVNYYDTHKVPVKKGLYILLKYLKKHQFKMAVASSSPRLEVERHLKDANVFSYFDGIVCGDMIEHSKPDPEIYIKACKMLGGNIKETYALEDSRNGLLAAYRAGCKPVVIPDLWEPDEEILRIIDGKYDDLEQVKLAFEKGEI